MILKRGDIVRNIFAPEIIGMVLGFGKGECFGKMFHFYSDEDIYLVMRKDGRIIPVAERVVGDYQVIDHYDMTDIVNKLN